MQCRTLFHALSEEAAINDRAIKRPVQLKKVNIFLSERQGQIQTVFRRVPGKVNTLAEVLLLLHVLT